MGKLFGIMGKMSRNLIQLTFEHFFCTGVKYTPFGMRIFARMEPKVHWLRMLCCAIFKQMYFLGFLRRRLNFPLSMTSSRSYGIRTDSSPLSPDNQIVYFSLPVFQTVQSFGTKFLSPNFQQFLNSSFFQKHTHEIESRLDAPYLLSFIVNHLGK